MNFIKRFLVPVVFLAVFIVTLSAMQAQKALLENKRSETVKQALQLLETGSVDEVFRHIDSHYSDAENLEHNRKQLEDFRIQRMKFGQSSKQLDAVFSVRSARIPEKENMTSDVYITRKIYERGEIIYTIGVVNSDATSIPQSDNQQWQLDRVIISLFPSTPDDDNQAISNSTLNFSVLCSEEKHVDKKCRKKD